MKICRIDGCGRIANGQRYCLEHEPRRDWPGGAIPVLPLHIVPAHEGSSLKPPLGFGTETVAGRGKRETRHLNLNWSIARLDALRICLRNSGLPLERIAYLYQSTPAEIERLSREMGEP